MCGFSVTKKQNKLAVNFKLIFCVNNEVQLYEFQENKAATM